MASDPRIQEAVKCGHDPVYFVNAYAKISHPTRGLLPLHCFPFQSEALQDFINYRFNIILKSRQMGISTISAAYAAWLAIFHPNKQILIIATKRDIAMNMIDKIKTILRSLPPFLLLKGIKSETKQTVSFNNGSVIKAVGTSADAGRSEGLSLLIVDEAAFIKDFDKLWTSLRPTLSTGGKAVILSTPNGVGNLFHKLYLEAEANINGFHPTRLMWNLHPERDMQWFLSETKSMTRREIAQELECNFEGSGDAFLTEQDMLYYQTLIKPPVIKRGPDNNIWIWKDVQKDKKYVISADVARGDAADNSTFHVIDIIDNEIVAEYKGKVVTEIFAQMLAETGAYYNNAMLCPENKIYGFAVLKKLKELKYQNIYSSNLNNNPFLMHPITEDNDNQALGFDTTSQSRLRIFTKLEIALKNKQLKIHSSRFLEEIKTLVFRSNKWEAMKGYNDDLVLSLAIGIWIYDFGDKNEAQDLELTQTLLKCISVNSTKYDDVKGALLGAPNIPTSWQPANVPGIQNTKNPEMRKRIKATFDDTDLNDLSWVLR